MTVPRSIENSENLDDLAFVRACVNSSSSRGTVISASTDPSNGLSTTAVFAKGHRRLRALSSVIGFPEEDEDVTRTTVRPVLSRSTLEIMAFGSCSLHDFSTSSDTRSGKVLLRAPSLEGEEVLSVMLHPSPHPTLHIPPCALARYAATIAGRTRAIDAMLILQLEET